MYLTKEDDDEQKSKEKRDNCLIILSYKFIYIH